MIVVHNSSYDMRILVFVLMPNHWHLILYPRKDGDMGTFMHKVTNAHTRKVHALTKTVGTGPLYQGRYKSFIIENDKHLLTVILTVMRYVERNPVRAKMVKRCEDWQWGSAFMRKQTSKDMIAPPPMSLPRNYAVWISEPETTDILEQVRCSVVRGAPFGGAVWKEEMLSKHSLVSMVRSEGRPKKI